MSSNWVKDINLMHNKYGVHRWVKRQVDTGNREALMKLLEFRLNFLSEELLEARKALAVEDPEEIVDAMIDLCVVAIGTLDAFDVDAEKAWNEVLKANMSKETGEKPGRPNPLGLPDLVKPAGWTPPSHKENYGVMPMERIKHPNEGKEGW